MRQNNFEILKHFEILKIFEILILKIVITFFQNHTINTSKRSKTPVWNLASISTRVRLDGRGSLSLRLFKAMNDLAPSYISDMFKEKTINYNL